MNTKSQQLNTALSELITALKTANLWHKTPPTASAFSSNEPFCVDTMPFETWLQWIFIPKVNEVLQKDQLSQIMHQSDIHSMAELMFKNHSQNTKETLQIIKNIDKILNSIATDTSETK